MLQFGIREIGGNGINTELINPYPIILETDFVDFTFQDASSYKEFSKNFNSQHTGEFQHNLRISLLK